MEVEVEVEVEASAGAVEVAAIVADITEAALLRSLMAVEFLARRVCHKDRR